MSSELKGAFTGRQYVAGSMQELNFAEDLVVGDTPLGTLPEGAVITSGWFQTVTGGSITGLLETELRDPVSGAVFDVLTTGDPNITGKADITITGIPTTMAYDIVATNTVLQTAGDGYLHLEYIVSGRSQFSEG